MVGQALLHYRIDAQLGAGAMGVVYRAYDMRLQRTVAIKLLQEPSPELSAARMLEEARAASRLNHPNICTIYEVGEIDGHAFIVMEYVDGRPLNELVPSGGLALETVIEYGRQIADAVGYAHEHGIVHRDIKSSNIVITNEGRAKVLDFGLARRLPPDGLETGGAAALHTTITVAGTPAYMSPEALRGEPTVPTSDVWSLGVVLFEMATGERPYAHGTPFELAADVLSQSPVVVPSTMSPPLAAVITRCLTKQSGRRYRQGGEVRAALEAILPSVAAFPATPPTRWPAYGRWLAIIAAGAVAATLILALGHERVRDGLGRLVAEPAIAFAERDWLLVADFDNQAGNPLFDRSLNTALSAALTQSRYVNLVPASRIRESLRRMEKQTLTRTDSATAREIALREGFRLVLAPAIASTGGAYLLAASFVDPASGATVRSETVRADSTSDVLPALDELSRKIRGALGEATAMLATQSKPLAKVTTSSLEALQLFTLGREAHVGQQLEKARSLYEEALRLDPAFTSARGSLGLINVEFFDRQKGIELLSQTINAADGLTDNERVSLLGFHAMYVENNLERAVDHYRAFLAVHPDVAAAHNNLGRIFMQMRRFDEAIGQLEETIRLDPDLFLAYFSLSSIHLYERNDADAAIQVAERQLARDSRSPRAYGQLGAAHAAKNDLRQAETTLRAALELDPRSLMDTYRLGHVLRLQGRYDEARKTYLRVLDIDPSQISAHYDAAAASELMGDRAAARRALDTVIEQSSRYLRDQPRDGERLLEMASAYARLGDSARATAIARQAAPYTAALPVERAGLSMQLGRTDEALDTLARAVDSDYRNVMWIRLHSDLHDLRGDPRLDAILASAR